MIFDKISFHMIYGYERRVIGCTQSIFLLHYSLSLITLICFLIKNVGIIDY